ncbi:MAG: hypothetical protein Q9160_002037 [Pyrenula sp. 1 TL-2023]
MFGAFRCNGNAGKNSEFVDLSGNGSVDARNYTVLVCELSSNPEIDSKSARRDAEAKNTRRAISAAIERLNAAAIKTAANDVKQRRPLALTARLRLPDPLIFRARSADIQRQNPNQRQNHPPRDSRQRGTLLAWVKRPATPVTPSDIFFNESLHDGYDINFEEPQGLDLSLRENVNAPPLLFPLPENHKTPPSESMAVSITNDDNLNCLLMTPPTNAHPDSDPAESSDSRRRRCNCILSLADIFESISSDCGSNTDGADRFDDLLVHLRDGIQACGKVLSCKYCSVCATHSMFIVTIVQQLATISQKLCLQVLAYQQKVTTPSTMDVPVLFSNAEIHVGKYQIRATALNLGFLFPIVSMHVRDLRQLLEHLRRDIEKGTKAFKLLIAAADTVQTASSDLPFTLQETLCVNKTPS